MLRMPSRRQLALWLIAVLDVMSVAWVLSAGDWLDRTAAVITLGGHHLVVLWLAVAGVALLGGVALLTYGLVIVVLGQASSATLLSGTRLWRGGRRRAPRTPRGRTSSVRCASYRLEV